MSTDSDSVSRRFSVRGAVSATLAVTLLLCSPASADEIDQIPSLKERILELYKASKLKEAAPLADKLLTLATQKYGDHHQETVEAAHWVAWFASIDGDQQKAEELWQKSLRIQ